MRNERCIRAQAGYAMLLVMLFTAAAVMVLAGVLQWSSTNARLTLRRNQYNATLFVAESVLNRVTLTMSQDFQRSGSATVDQNLTSYQRWSGIPGGTSILSNYNVMDLSGNANSISVISLTNWAYMPLQTPYSYLYGRAATYRLGCQVKALTSPPVVSALQQDVELASFPLFQFGAFYSPDLEVCPSQSMTITGPVHGNSPIYCQPSGVALVFSDPLSSGQDVLLQKSPSDPVVRSPGTVQFLSGTSSRMRSLNLPIGGTNTPAALHAIVDVPPPTESISSPLGQQRYYNNADLIILVSNATVVAKSGSYNGFSTTFSWSLISQFVATNISFFDKREGKTIQTSQFDVSHFIDYYFWLAYYLGRYPKTVYIADQRTQSSSTEPGVRVVNGQTLPSVGLTIATPNPLYVLGDYNAPNSYNLSSTNTSGTAPASLVGDALTFLSDGWRDNNSQSGLPARGAADTTFNAAVIFGIVPSGGGYYSGGLENGIRLLENWTGHTFTFNGSRVVLYYSQTAKAPWGASSDVYNPPKRAYAFDPNFKDSTKLPPRTPEARTLIRANWVPIQPTSH